MKISTIANSIASLFDLAAGPYDEDFTIPEFTASVKEGDITGTIVVFSGDTASLPNVVINYGIAAAAGKRPIRFEGIEWRDEHPAADSATLHINSPGIVVVADCNFTNIDGSANRAIVAYGGGVIAKGSIDFGTDTYSNRVVVKNLGGFVDETQGNTTGSRTGNVFKEQIESLFAIDTQSPVSVVLTPIVVRSTSSIAPT